MSTAEPMKATRAKSSQMASKLPMMVGISTVSKYALLACLLAMPAWGAIGFKAKCNIGNVTAGTTAITCTPSSSIAIGDAVLAEFSVNTASTAATGLSVTDNGASGGNTYTLLASTTTSTTNQLFIYGIASATKTATTITAHYTIGVGISQASNLSMVSYTGLGTNGFGSNFQAVSGSTSAGNHNVAPAAYTTDEGNDWVVFFYSDTGTSTSASCVTTCEETNSSGGRGNTQTVVDSTAAGTSVTTSFVNNISISWIGFQVELRISNASGVVRHRAMVIQQ